MISNDYEEVYPENIAYCTYERDIAEKEQEISNLQEEIYKKDKEIEKLENQIEYAKKELDTEIDVKNIYFKLCEELKQKINILQNELRGFKNEIKTSKKSCANCIRRK